MKTTQPETVEAPGLVAGWNRFWFRPADPTTLGLIRVCCGLVVLYIHWVYTFDLQALLGPDAWLNLSALNETRQNEPLYTPPDGWEMPHSEPPRNEAEARDIDRWGGNPRQAYSRGHYIWSFWFHVTDPAGMGVVHAAVLVVLLLFTLGVCTRVTSVLTFLAALSYVHRAPTALFGMDTIMAILLLYLMIGPSGAALSVDRLLARRWAARRGRPVPPPPEPSVSANFALRLMQVHFCIIYFAAGTSKLLGSAWWSGTALWGTVANYEFAPLQWEPYANALGFLSAHRWLWEVCMTSGVVFTLLLELGFPFLVWDRRLRGWMVLGAALLHTGIALCMGLSGFGLLMLTLVLSFVPGTGVRRLLTRLAPDHAPPALRQAA